MRTLPIEYWQYDYPEIPKYYQRYWVQRCLELLDADTGYIFGLDLVNSATLIRDLVETSSVRHGRSDKGSNARTFHFLLNELYARFASDVALVAFVERNEPSSIDLYEVVSQGVEKSSLLFGPAGLGNNNSVGLTNKKFAMWLEEKGMAQGRDAGIMKRVYTALENDRRGWLRAHEAELRCLLNQPTQGVRNAHLETSIDTVTRSWLFEMIVQNSCGPVYLSEVLRTTFLKQRRECFSERLELLFDELRPERHKFTVFMRLQARKELGHIGKVEQVRFSISCPEGYNIVEELLANAKIGPREARRAKDFFFDGEASKRLVFAIAQVEAGNIGSATRSSIHFLDAALNKARFEYERSRLSIDNTVYVYDHTQQSLTRFTRRQALADRYVAKGHPVHFERLIYRLNQLQSIPDSRIDESIINQLTDLALQWHRHAVESSPPEIRFMNHWIELEQLFKTAKSLNLTSASPGDTLVRALAQALIHREKRLLLQDLWGDLQRCNVMGSKPYLVRHSGRARYTESYLSHLYQTDNRSYRRWKDHPIDVEILDENNKRLKGYRIPAGFRVFVEDGQYVRAGMWLAGPDLARASKLPILRPLFKGVVPGLANTLYLALHWDVVSCLATEQQNYFNDMQWDKLRSLSRRDALDYEQAQRLANDLWYEMREQLRPENLLADEDRIDTELKELGWTNQSGIRSRLRHVTAKLQRLRDNGSLAVLSRLEELAFELKDSTGIPNPIWLELFRDCSPNYEAFENLLLQESDPLLQILPEQPLLKSRVEQVVRRIQRINEEKVTTAGERTAREEKLVSYASVLDRMRRTRNTLVHNGTVSEEISLLSRELYYYSKTYLKAVIYELTPPAHSQSLKSDPFMKSALFIRRI